MVSVVLKQLHREHASIAGVLYALERQTRRLERGDDPDFALMTLAMDYLLDFPDRCHHPKEDLIFRRLRARHPQAVQPVGDLLEAHAALAASARAFARDLRDVLDGRVVLREELHRRAHDFIDRQWQHLAKEEATFFPAAQKALTPRDWSELAAAMPMSTDPLSAREAGRFEEFRDTILAWQQDNDEANKMRANDLRLSRLGGSPASPSRSRRA